jgi:hypothetical protein
MQRNSKATTRARSFGMGLVAVLLGAGAASAMTDITYLVDQKIGDGSVVGSVTTDGVTGLLADSDFLDWSLFLTGKEGATFTLNPLDSNVYEQGADVVASATDITFNFSGSDSGYLLFQQGTDHSGQEYWCNATFSGICLQGKSVSPVVYPDANFQNIPATGIQVIANVPEPSTWFLVTVGFAALGVGATLRGRKALRSSSPL